MLSLVQQPMTRSAGFLSLTQCWSSLPYVAYSRSTGLGFVILFYVYESLCAQVCGGHTVPPSIPLYLNLEFTDWLDWVDRESQAPLCGPSPPHSTSLGLDVHQAQLLRGCQGSKLRFSRLHSKHSAHWGISPVPRLFLFMTIFKKESTGI